jgi:hypothetical protein
MHMQVIMQIGPWLKAWEQLHVDEMSRVHALQMIMEKITSSEWFETIVLRKGSVGLRSHISCMPARRCWWSSATSDADSRACFEHRRAPCRNVEHVSNFLLPTIVPS